MAKNLEELGDLVYIWAKDKGIIDAGDIEAQAGKLVEEAVESLKEAVIINTVDWMEREEFVNNLKMEMGDCLVVLTIMASVLDTDLFTCLDMAYRKINKRKGKMVDGVFVKDE